MDVNETFKMIYWCERFFLNFDNRMELIKGGYLEEEEETKGVSELLCPQKICQHLTSQHEE